MSGVEKALLRLYSFTMSLTFTMPSLSLAEHSMAENATAAFDHDDGKPWSSVILPDFFVSFLSVTPRTNPHYERVRAESERWISE